MNDLKPISLNYGCDLDSLTQYVKEGFVTYALNANIQSDGSSKSTYTNEPSNILCSNFKPNYYVIGFKFIVEQNRTIFFLTNPITGDSEIGEIKDISFTDDELFVEDINKITNCKDCKGLLNSSYPVLHLKNNETCKYTTILTAKCLNFSINHPIEIEYKTISCGTLLYFTDKFNGRRFINLDDLPYKKVQQGCELIKTTTVDCNAMLVQPLFNIPCINIVEVLESGTLESGTYQFAIQYSNIAGEELSKYYGITNPCPIKDNKLLLDLGQETNKAIKLQLNNLEKSVYNYFNLIVIKTVRNVTSSELIGTFPTTLSEYTYTGNNKTQIKIAVEDVFKDFPYYNTARGLTKSNGYLMWYGLETPPLYNFQKVASNIKLEWVTHRVKDTYVDPKNTIYLKGYQRDEVYAFGIVFQLDDGSETNVFPLVGRDSISTDLETIPFTNLDNLNAGIDCDSPATDKPRWKVYNTGDINETFPIVKDACEDVPYQKGVFSYWESSLNYPNNKEIWGDLCGTPIRHFKFPDNLVTHIHDSGINIPNTVESQFNYKPFIFPIGIRIDEASFNNALTYIPLEYRKRLKGFRIVRGNRANNKSVIAKGLLYNVGKYDIFDTSNKITESIFYPNYPFNDLRKDPFLFKNQTIYNSSDTNTSIEDCLDGFQSDPNNTRYTFHSPDTHFYNPGLGNIIKLETEEYGFCKTTFVPVEKHAKYKFTTLADIGIIGVFVATAILSYTGSSGVSGVGINGNLMSIVLELWEVGKRIIKSSIPFRNYCYQQNSVGHYNKFETVLNTGSKQRLLAVAEYIESKGLYNVSDDHLINNYHRESSVYLKTIQTLPNTQNVDTSRILASNVSCETNTHNFQTIASYYASIKRELPDQYGPIDNIEWLDTGYCGTIVNSKVSNLEDIFGGDTFITKFALKRKLRYFNDDKVGFPDESDIDYEYTRNIGYPRFFFNTSPPDIAKSVQGVSGVKFWQNLGNNLADLLDRFFNVAKNNFDCDTTPILSQNGKIYLYNYGIPYFYVESDINTSYRYFGNDTHLDYYPHSGGELSIPNDWLQESKTSIAFDNSYLYNKDYSKQNKENSLFILPSWYSAKNCYSKFDNRVIYSVQSFQEDIKDNWLTYKSLDYYDFPTENGKLMILKGIDNAKVLAIFENTFTIYNAYNTIETNVKTALIGTGGMFSQPPQEFSKSDLGYGGTQHKAFISNQFGQFWTDCSKGNIFNLTSRGLNELSSSKYKWSRFFNDNLPFKINKYFPSINIDNPYNGIGIAMGWDYKYDRLFITKLDYIPINDNVRFNEALQLFYDVNTNQKIELTNTDYFCSKCWTAAYSPENESWIGFYSFQPQYYIGYANYFKTGINGKGLWSHLLTNKSYQTFYNELHPYTLEYPINTGIQSTILQSIEYSQQIKEYFKETDFYSITNVNFNKACIYNDNQTSGILNLVHTPKNNLFIFKSYPKYNSDSKDILYSVYENKYSFNTFWDITKNITNSHQPIHTVDCNAVFDKVLNDANIDYNQRSNAKNRIRGQYCKVRLTQDIYNRYKFINYFNLSENQLSN